MFDVTDKELPLDAEALRGHRWVPVLMFGLLRRSALAL
jgi:hypothetical protein